MSHFARVINEIVVDVVVAEQDFINTGLLGPVDQWIQTSYNTKANQHPEGRPLRGNYAGIGFVYDSGNDVFYAPQPYASWTLDSTTWSWTAPVAYPADGKEYTWNEEILNWIEKIQE